MSRNSSIGTYSQFERSCVGGDCHLGIHQAATVQGRVTFCSPKLLLIIFEFYYKHYQLVEKDIAYFAVRYLR